jgi:hypothetical protein
VALFFGRASPKYVPHVLYAQDFWVVHTRETGRYSRLKIERGFPPSHCQKDNLVQIGIGLKLHDHGCMACLWRHASAIF